MGRYRRIDVVIWNDERFHALSDDGKLGFLFLLTHPGMTALGAMRATWQGLAAELGWRERRLRAALAPAVEWQMVVVDEEASFLRLRSFFRYNAPENPNQVRAWKAASDLIPECQAKRLLLEDARTAAVELGEPFGKAFAERLHQPSTEQSGKRFGDGSAIQEQEQEQETNTVAPPAVTPPREPKAKRQHDGNGVGPVFESFWQVYPGRGGRKRNRSDAAKLWLKLSAEDRIAALADVADRLDRDEQWRRGFPPDAHRYLRKRGWTNDEQTTTELPYTPA